MGRAAATGRQCPIIDLSTATISRVIGPIRIAASAGVDVPLNQSSFMVYTSTGTPPTPPHTHWRTAWGHAMSASTSARVCVSICTSTRTAEHAWNSFPYAHTHTYLVYHQTTFCTLFTACETHDRPVAIPCGDRRRSECLINLKNMYSSLSQRMERRGGGGGDCDEIARTESIARRRTNNLCIRLACERARWPGPNDTAQIVHDTTESPTRSGFLDDDGVLMHATTLARTSFTTILDGTRRVRSPRPQNSNVLAGFTSICFHD